MSNDEENTNNGLRRIGAVGGVAVLATLVAARYYHEAYPQFLEQHLGSFGLALLFIAGGCYLASMAVMGVRNRAITGNYVSVEFKRADRPFMFWFMVVFDFAGGMFLLFGGFGHFFWFVVMPNYSFQRTLIRCAVSRR